MTVVLLWLGCASAPQDSQAQDSSCFGGNLSGTVHLVLGGGVLSGANVFAQQGQDTPIQTVADGEGGYALFLPTGAWTLWAESSPGCFGDRIDVEVIDCETTALDLFTDTCDGR